MKYIHFVLLLSLSLTGCATKMAYLNTARTAEEIKKDKEACEAAVNTANFNDPGVKRNKLNDCMKGKGYKVVSEAEAEKIQGFRELWIKPGADIKAYEVIFIDKVDVSQAKVANTNIPDAKVTDEDIDNLAKQMWERFAKAVNNVMSVVADKEKASGKKALYLSLKLNNISPNNIGINAALEAAGQVSGLPMPSAPQGAFSFEGAISDYSGNEKLITISDECNEDKNASLAGLENFERWKHAHNIIDYWADHLAALLAKELGKEYKSRLGFKLVDF